MNMTCSLQEEDAAWKWWWTICFTANSKGARQILLYGFFSAVWIPTPPPNKKMRRVHKFDPWKTSHKTARNGNWVLRKAKKGLKMDQLRLKFDGKGPKIVGFFAEWGGGTPNLQLAENPKICIRRFQEVILIQFSSEVGTSFMGIFFKVCKKDTDYSS